MIIFPILNFVLPLMLTCLVLVDDPPRCSECRKKMDMKVVANNADEIAQLNDPDVFNANPQQIDFMKK